jgi:hypothetical protein
MDLGAAAPKALAFSPARAYLAKLLAPIAKTHENGSKIQEAFQLYAATSIGGKHISGSLRQQRQGSTGSG